jgi:hypothetical protein
VASRGLRVRLLGGTVLVAAGAVAATAWLAVQGTTGSIAEQQDQVNEVSAQAYGSLVDYAATHTDWSGVQPTLAGMSASLGSRVTLTPVGGAPIAGSPGPSGPVHTGPSLQIDPLAVDNAMARTQFPDGIDPAVVGPFRLSTAEHADLEARIEDDVKCLQARGVAVTIAEVPGGRPYLRLTEAVASPGCVKDLVIANWPIGFQDTPQVTPTPTEQTVLERLTLAMKNCLTQDGERRGRTRRPRRSEPGRRNARSPGRPVPGGRTPPAIAAVRRTDRVPAGHQRAEQPAGRLRIVAGRAASHRGGDRDRVGADGRGGNAAGEPGHPAGPRTHRGDAAHAGRRR